MHLKDTKLGDIINIYIAPNKALSNLKEAQIMRATVIGKDQMQGVLGWKPLEDHPMDASLRSGTTVASISYIDNQSEFTHSTIRRLDFLIHSIVHSFSGQISSGCICKICHQLAPYAMPNQMDGKFICYGCKIDW